MNQTKTKSKPKPKKLNSIHTLEIFKKRLLSSSFSQNINAKMKKELLSLIDLSIDLIEKHPDPVLFDKNIYENLRICIQQIPIAFQSFKTFLQENHLLSKNNRFSILSVLTRLENEMITGKKRFNLSQKKPPVIAPSKKYTIRKNVKPFRGGNNALGNVLGSISRFFRRNINNDAQVHLQQVAEFVDTDRVIANSQNNDNNDAGPGAYVRPGSSIKPHAVGTKYYPGPEPGTGILQQLLEENDETGYSMPPVEFEILEDENTHPNTDPNPNPLITHLSNQELMTYISNRIDRWCYWDTAGEMSLFLFITILGTTSFIGGVVAPGAGFAIVPIYYFIFTGLIGASFFLKNGWDAFRFTKNKEKCKEKKINEFLQANQVSIENWNNGNVDIESWMHDPERTSIFPWIWKEIQRQNQIISPGDTMNIAEPIPNIESDLPPTDTRTRSSRTRTRTRTRRTNPWAHQPPRIQLQRPGSRSSSRIVVPTIIEDEEEN